MGRATPSENVGGIQLVRPFIRLSWEHHDGGMTSFQ